MEKEERSMSRRTVKQPQVETEFFLQWGSRKRLRCVRVRGHNPAEVSSSSRIRRRITSRFLTFTQKEASLSQQPTSSRYTRNSEVVTLRSENRKSSSGSFEKEERYYRTRGSTIEEENGKIRVDEENHHHHHHKNINGSSNGIGIGIGLGLSSNKKMNWPKLCIGLSSKEKEEDFMAMKGSKLPQRPSKKRAKVIQRTLLLVSPGAWLADMSLERYEVREKKSCKKKARGLKAMGSMESDSE